MPMLDSRTTRNVVSFATLAMAAAIVIARPYISLAAAWALLVIFIGFAVVATLAYWRAIGEVAREGQKTAWFWGGIIGAAVAMTLATIPAVVPLIGAVIDWIDTSASVINASFVAGMIWMFAAQMIGFTIYWAFWWIARR